VALPLAFSAELSRRCLARLNSPCMGAETGDDHVSKPREQCLKNADEAFFASTPKTEPRLWNLSDNEPNYHSRFLFLGKVKGLDPSCRRCNHRHGKKAIVFCYCSCSLGCNYVG
jgi:hypothetical protein